MALNCGIVGLPNVGKSTIFSAVTSAPAEAANYPFCTIDPNIGMVAVPDKRLDRIVKLIPPAKVIPATVEFVDIAGLVAGASKGEGLGNQFLSHIRQTDAICHVVRCFDNPDITHVEGSVDPIRDIEIINLELCIADLQSVENRILKVERKAQAKEKDSLAEYNVLSKLVEALRAGKAARSVSLDKDEMEVAKSYQLLTMKPMIYVANMSEDDVADPDSNHYYQSVKEYALNEGNDVIAICAEIEEELSKLSKEEKQMFLDEMGIKQSGLDSVIKAAYHLLGLKTFFTVGEPECRAWTFKDGMLAPDCAGVIHTDFKKGFIRAETYSYDDLMEYKTEASLKEHGKLRLEGKDYVVQDGDVMHFRFNV